MNFLCTLNDPWYSIRGFVVFEGIHQVEGCQEVIRESLVPGLHFRPLRHCCGIERLEMIENELLHKQLLRKKIVY